jgi:hypothetical protein
MSPWQSCISQPLIFFKDSRHDSIFKSGHRTAYAPLTHPALGVTLSLNRDSAPKLSYVMSVGISSVGITVCLATSLFRRPL